MHPYCDTKTGHSVTTEYKDDVPLCTSIVKWIHKIVCITRIDEYLYPTRLDNTC